MNKFKVGDKVRIISHSGVDFDRISSDIKKHGVVPKSQQVGVIKSSDSFHKGVYAVEYKVDLSKMCLGFSEQNLKLISNNKTNMKKDSVVYLVDNCGDYASYTKKEIDQAFQDGDLEQGTEVFEVKVTKKLKVANSALVLKEVK